jgi:hypothetical protein
MSGITHLFRHVAIVLQNNFECPRGSGQSRAPTNWFGGKAIGRHAVFPSCSPNSSAAICSRSCIFLPSH